MMRPRLIVCLLLKNGLIVRSELFKIHQIIGNPIDTVHRLSGWNVDELVILDISETNYHDMRRDDLHVSYSGSGTLDLLEKISEVCFMPLSFGGRIASLEDIQERLSSGADKCIINTKAIENPQLISDASKAFGSQCIVVSIDVKVNASGMYEVYSCGGEKPTGLDPVLHAKEMERLGAGEIFLNSIDRDGIGNGYDIELINRVTSAVSIPVIACGGVGSYEHFVEGVVEGKANAVAAANIFHFFEQSYPRAKKHCIDAGLTMRPYQVSSSWFSREPKYPPGQNIRRYEDRLSRSRKPLENTTNRSEYKQNVRWCSKCLYPWISATPMEFDDDNICMGCRMSEMKSEFSTKEWDRRKQLLIDLFEKTRCPNGSRHDCIVPVSGGKDSHFQVHYIKNVLGYNPLLVTYYGNNFSSVGERNLYAMKERFGVDHLIYYPSVETLKKLNRLGLIVMGDMNWHNHVGAASVTMRAAVENGIPLVIWGEHGYADLCGQFSMNDFVEWTYRNRLEHYARGYEWNYFVGLEGLTESDMNYWKYPSDEEIFKLDLRGIYLSNYTHWEANQHTKLVREKYGFEISEQSFDRTYRKMSNLDDIHENGIHDYLRFIKFGYGRCTDHASKDVRAGIMSRDEATRLVRQYDHVKPSDLKRWLEYTGMSEEEFDGISDTFRDPRVWRRENGEWVKDNVWD
ncbi:MAG: imidazole glycerol phosphate synthase subunit HisF [Gammaproteobacteria bacterium]|nr:imidazole glycerol phosphate synthase subunit HisF [Gammaproteobacteria bacterium]